jgi:hypothetical protein
MNLYELQCREVVDVLTDYFEGVLPVERRVVLEQHLLFCAGCTEYVDQLRTSIELTGRLQEADVPATVMARLTSMFTER